MAQATNVSFKLTIEFIRLKVHMHSANTTSSDVRTWNEKENTLYLKKRLGPIAIWYRRSH